MPSIARLQGVPPFHSRAGRSTSNRNPTCSDWQKGGFSRHAEIFSGTTSSIAVAHAINTNADEHGPPAPVVPPLVSGYSLVGCSSAEPASASPACHYNSSVRVFLSNIPISFDYELTTPQDRIYQQILSTRQSKEESGVEMKKRLGERRNTPERKQGRKQEEFAGPFLPP